MKMLEADRLIMREWNINDSEYVYEYAKSEINMEQMDGSYVLLKEEQPILKGNQ